MDWDHFNLDEKQKTLQDVLTLHQHPEYYERLKNDYEYISSVHELDTGRYIRWVILATGKIHNGGVVMSINIDSAKGPYLVFKSHFKYFGRLYFNDVLVFQRYRKFEKLYLQLTSEASSSSSSSTSSSSESDSDTSSTFPFSINSAIA